MNELDLLALSPSPEVFEASTEIVQRGAIKERRRSTDATFLFASCEGSGKTPYIVSADLGVPTKPVTSCTCPSRKRPCKHALALLVAHARDPGGFVESEVPAELGEQREQRARVQEKAKKPKAVRAPNRQAQAKKAQGQLEGLELAQRVLGELATTGLGTLDEARRTWLAERAREVADFHLPGLATALRRLSLGLADEPDPETHARVVARQMAQLFAMVKKGRALLEQALEDKTNDEESDAAIEELLGKVWQLTELGSKGFVRKNVELVELAYQRMDDAAREERLEISYVVELESGEILRELAYVPARRIGKEPPKPSHDDVLQIGEAVVYPGFANRRVRWEPDAGRTRAIEPADLQRIGASAIGITDAIARLVAQHKQLLAPERLVVLLRVARVGRVDGVAVLEDAGGTRIAVASDPDSSAAMASLEHWGWPPLAHALLAELSLDPRSAGVVASPLAIVASDGVLRLGL